MSLRVNDRISALLKSLKKEEMRSSLPDRLLVWIYVCVQQLCEAGSNCVGCRVIKFTSLFTSFVWSSDVSGEASGESVETELGQTGFNK